MSVTLIICVSCLLIISTDDNKSIIYQLSLLAVASIRILPAYNSISSSLVSVRYNMASLKLLLTYSKDFSIQEKSTLNNFDRINYNSAKKKNNNKISKNFLLIRNISYKYPNTKNLIIKNLSLNKLIPLYDKILAVKLEILQIQIKRRKAQDLIIAANAASQVPVPNVALATEYAQRATQYTANELNSLEDLAEAYKEFEAIKEKVEFYGTKYEKTKNQLLNIQQTINNYQSQIFNKALTQVNNQLTGSYNQLTGSVVTRISNITGSTTI